MGFGIIKMKKISGSLGGILSHVLRAHKSRTNPDIDYSKSANNYSLMDDKKKTISELNKRIYDRIKSLPGKEGKKRKVSKNAVKLADFFVGLSPEVIPEADPQEIENYFRDALYFLEFQYGRENIVYAEVHLEDEATPHLHVGVVPELENRLCAKELFTRKSLHDLQEKFYKDVSSYYGLEKPIGGRRGLDVKEFKGLTGQVQKYLKNAVFERIKEDIQSGNKKQVEVAEAALRYLRDRVPEDWQKDWFWMDEFAKDAEKNRLGEDRY